MNENISKTKKKKYQQLKSLKIETLISVSAKHNREIKKEIKNKLNSSLYFFEPSVKGVMLSYSGLKLRKKLITIIEEQDYLNIPVSYEAVFYFPKEGETINGEVIEITEKILKLEAFGCIFIYIDLDLMSENININPGVSINLLEQKKSIKIGDFICGNILKFYIRPDKSLVLAASIDLDNYNPVYNK